MRFIVVSVCFAFCLQLSALAQVPRQSEISDSAKVNPIIRQIQRYFFLNPDTTVVYSEKLILIAQESGDYPLMNYALQIAGEGYRGLGNFPRSLKMQLNALQLNKEKKDSRREAYTSSFIGFTYSQYGYYDQALFYLLPAKQVLENLEEWIQCSFTTSNIAYCYIMLNRFDSANWYNIESQRIWKSGSDMDKRKMALRTLILDRIGSTFKKEGKLEDAKIAYHLLLQNAKNDGIQINISRGQKNLAGVFMTQNKTDSALYYAWQAMESCRLDRQVLNSIETATILFQIYQKARRPDSALYYQSIVMELKDSVYGVDKFRELQFLMHQEQQRQHDLEAEKTELRSRLRFALLAVIAASLLIVALILRRNNKVKQNTNRLLGEQKLNLEKTLAELKSTQAQLVQSEKMASLGELTAGIAHEIQNPLNFVNNFSDVNTELIDEANSEIDQGNLEEAKAILSDLKDNQQKINHHGKRADTIVKNMLQHSHTTPGEKAFIDINGLADEYLRLAYSGLRAKNKDFKAAIITHFDESIGKVIIVSQDIARVLLNLFNNALYAVAEKQKESGNLNGNRPYVPQVTVTTGKNGNTIILSVKDNGNGIPEKDLGKVFQPFFTTKPTGQGTGLGLSLSYDITKAHQGEIKINNKPGEGVEFIVSLPGS